ncbi:SIR2 family NAD-dependent protein deacylase [Oryzibacter oryziterrae]|uniref:SIR2 family NAD-dependent protein deacylase n=1 Tax=Oryzibacter oryziterrae TaxID=2766474 RepID=UPI001F2C6BA8|nr:SIR2 family protein [Oryzibacter oryziterrae]
MTALLSGGELIRVTGADALALLADVRASLAADRLVPYLGPDLLALDAPAAVPILPEEVAKLLHKRTPAPSRIRTNMWSVAQYIDSRKHRKTLTAYMVDIFGAPPQPTAFHRWLAGQPLSMLVDSWYDSTLRAALVGSGRSDVVDVQGTTRAGINLDQWYLSYDLSGAVVPGEKAGAAATILYTPHGGVAPAGNFLVADSDYVEVLTEIDIQTPIPLVVQERRTTRGFLFLGCRFHDQMLRTYARQIMKRSSGPHYAVADCDKLQKNEAKFFAAQGIVVLDIGLKVATDLLMQ